jgi:hypothetical protein
VVGEIEVIAEAKRKPDRAVSARDKRERTHQENALDEALKDPFPASDPVSVTDTARRRPRQGKDLKDDEVALRDAIERLRLLVCMPPRCCRLAILRPKARRRRRIDLVSPPGRGQEWHIR